MAKITIEIDDQDGHVAVTTTVNGHSDDSKACQLTDRIMMFIDRIAERQDKEEPSLIQMPNEPPRSAANLAHLASKSVAITH